LLASSALPPIVRPVEINGNLYIDGAVRSNVPTVSAKQFKADIVIAVPVDETLRPVDIKKFVTVRAVADRVSNIVLSIVDEHQVQSADCAVTPDVSNIDILSKHPEDVTKAIKAGETAAIAAMPEIKKLLIAHGATKTSLDHSAILPNDASKEMAAAH
jgi:NTE family protein